LSGRLGDVVFYIGVDDVEKKLKEVEKAGGKTVKTKSEVPRFGWEALFKDVFGNILGLFTALKK